MSEIEDEMPAKNAGILLVALLIDTAAIGFFPWTIGYIFINLFGFWGSPSVGSIFNSLAFVLGLFSINMQAAKILSNKYENSFKYFIIFLICLTIFARSLIRAA